LAPMLPIPPVPHYLKPYPGDPDFVYRYDPLKNDFYCELCKAWGTADHATGEKHRKRVGWGVHTYLTVQDIHRIRLQEQADMAAFLEARSRYDQTVAQWQQMANSGCVCGVPAQPPAPRRPPALTDVTAPAPPAPVQHAPAPYPAAPPAPVEHAPAPYTAAPPAPVQHAPAPYTAAPPAHVQQWRAPYTAARQPARWRRWCTQQSMGHPYWQNVDTNETTWLPPVPPDIELPSDYYSWEPATTSSMPSSSSTSTCLALTDLPARAARLVDRDHQVCEQGGRPDGCRMGSLTLLIQTIRSASKAGGTLTQSAN
jgi:hypothetical protein